MAIQYKVHKFVDSAWVLQGTTSGLSWPINSSLTDYGSIQLWRVDTYDTETELTTTGDTWVFTVETFNYFIESSSEPAERPTLYDGGLIYISDGSAYDWFDPALYPDFLAVGGGRYRKQLVAIGHEKIFFESL